jgi:hypothetical protein
MGGVYAMKKNRRLSRLFALFILFLLASVTPLAPAYADQVAVTVEKLTVDGEFIVEPLLVTLSGSRTAEDVTTRLLSSRSIRYESSGHGEDFYLAAVYDPSNSAYLGMTLMNTLDGWMITVNNIYIGTSAGAHTLRDGDVMRWQYTRQLGADIGGNPDDLGGSRKPDKDDLIWRVAEINAAGNQSDYGSAYTNALSVLKNLNASQSAIRSALAVLNGESAGTTPGGEGTNPGGDTGTGTTPGGETTPGGTTPGYDPGTTPDAGNSSDAGTPSSGGSSSSSSDTGTDQGTPPGEDQADPVRSPDTTPDADPGADAGTEPDTDLDAGTSTANDTTEDKVEQSVTAPVFAPPAGMEAGSSVSLASVSELQALGLNTPVSESSDGTVTVSSSAFADGLSEETASSIDTARPITPLPAFRAGVSDGGAALVSLKVRLDSYDGETMEGIAVLKMRLNGSVGRLDTAPSTEGIRSGSFIWTDADGNAVPPSNRAVAGRDYFLSVAIEDGSDYDLDETPGTIVDPLALAVGTPESEDKTAIPDIGKNGGGGCDAGAVGLIALAILCAVMISRGRR